MDAQEALRIVYDLASLAALDLDHPDAELREEASRQEDALDIVFDLLPNEDMPAVPVYRLEIDAAGTPHLIAERSNG